MKREAKWSVTDVPNEFLRERIGGATLEELEIYMVLVSTCWSAFPSPFELSR
jgi:hypothetical protein